jgi:hypothetical protein
MRQIIDRGVRAASKGVTGRELLLAGGRGDRRVGRERAEIESSG